MKGPLLLLAGIVSFSLLDATGKLLSGTYSVAQAIACRWTVMLLLLLLARSMVRGAGGPLRTGRPWLHLLRGVVMVFSAAGFYLGFRRVPLAEGYLVFFTSPFITLALTPWLLRERVPGAAWLWSAVGFGGVLVSATERLGAGGAVAGYLFILGATACFSLTQVLNRQLRAEPGWARLALYPALIGILAYAPFAAAQWVPPTPSAWALLAANGIFAGAGVLLSATAYQVSDPARLGPYGFAALPCSVLLDLFVWGRWPDLATLLGGVIVVFACVMSERAARRAKLQGMAAGKTWRPAASSGSGVTERTAESGSAP